MSIACLVLHLGLIALQVSNNHFGALLAILNTTFELFPNISETITDRAILG